MNNEFDDYDPRDDMDDSEFESYSPRPQTAVAAAAPDVALQEIMSLVVKSKMLWTQCSRILAPENFSEPESTLVGFVQEHYGKYGDMPTDMAIRAAGIEYPFLPVHDDDIMSKSTHEYVSGYLERRVVHRVGTEKLLAIGDLFAGDPSRQEILGALKELQDSVTAIDTGKRASGFNLRDDVGTLLELARQSTSIPTGMAGLDEALGGGTTLPSLNIVSADSGGGKSVALQNLAITYAMQGEPVIYFSVELAEYMIAVRLYSIITGLDPDYILNNEGEVTNKVNEFFDMCGGDIHISRSDMGSTSVSDLRRVADELEVESSKQWNRIMIDYMDILTPSDTRIKIDNQALKDNAISTEMYAWSHSEGDEKIIWTAAQQTKGANDEEEPSVSRISGGTAKVNTADNIFILKRNDYDKEVGRCWWHCVKGRNGGFGSAIPMAWEKDTVFMDSKLEMWHDSDNLKLDSVDGMNLMRSSGQTNSTTRTAMPVADMVVRGNISNMKSGDGTSLENAVNANKALHDVAASILGNDGS